MPSIDPIVRIATEVNGRLDEWDEPLRDKIMKMTFTDSATKPDKMSLEFDDSDLTLRESSRLGVDSKVAVLFGYPGRTYGDSPVVFKIKTRKGFRKLTIEGTTIEVTTFLGRQRMRTWEDATEWEVAEEIARGLGFTEDELLDIDRGDNEEIRRGITQSGETDWAFLRRIASRVGCSCYTSRGVFHFHPPRYDGVPLKTLTYFDSEEGEFLSDPEIEITPLGRAGRVTRRGVDTRERSSVTGTSGNNDDDRRAVCGDELVCREPLSWETEIGLSEQERTALNQMSGQERIEPTTAQSDDEAQRSSRNAFRASERETVGLSAPIVGDPDIVSGELIRIEGIGSQLSGNYFIDEAVHEISNGYTTKIKCKRNALGRSGSNSRARREELDTTSNDVADRELYTQQALGWEIALGVDPNARVNNSQPQSRRPVMWEDVLLGEAEIE